MLEKLGQLLQGKKTFIVAVLTFVAGGLVALGVQIPEYVWIILAGAGLGSIRSAINKK